MFLLIIDKLQWWFLRLSVLFLIPTLLLDLEIIFLLYSFLFLHMYLGLKSIINDYVHDKKLKYFFLILIRLCSFEFTRCVLELLI